jgi:hypothetical protein
VAVTLIATAFVALVAGPALVALWPQREPMDEASPRTAGQMSNFSAPTAVNRG